LSKQSEREIPARSKRDQDDSRNRAASGCSFIEPDTEFWFDGSLQSDTTRILAAVQQKPDGHTEGSKSYSFRKLAELPGFFLMAPTLDLHCLPEPKSENIGAQRDRVMQYVWTGIGFARDSRDERAKLSSVQR
jgi:hypothetical protein